MKLKHGQKPQALNTDSHSPPQYNGDLEKTYDEAIPDFLEVVKSRSSRGTYRFYKQHLRYFSQYFGNMRISDVNATTLAKFVNIRRDENPDIKNKTLNKGIMVVRCLYRFVTGEEIDYKNLREHKAEIKIVTEQTIDKIFTYYEADLGSKNMLRNYLMFRVFLDTGVRMNELIHIRLKNIDFKTNSILLQTTKNSEDRYVFFTRETALCMERFIALHGKGEFLFHSLRDSGMMTTEAIESLITRLKNTLGIKGSITPHKWRHTFGTKYIRRNGNIEHLRRLLGHKDIKMTQQYLHLDKEDLRKGYRETIGE